MKKSFIKKTSIALACFLGLGVTAGAISTIQENVAPVSALAANVIDHNIIKNNTTYYSEASSYDSEGSYGNFKWTFNGGPWYTKFTSTDMSYGGGATNVVSYFGVEYHGSDYNKITSVTFQCDGVESADVYGNKKLDVAINLSGRYAGHGEILSNFKITNNSVGGAIKKTITFTAENWEIGFLLFTVGTYNLQTESPNNIIKLKNPKWTFGVAENTVTLNGNGGTPASQTVKATSGSAMPAATKPSRTGYTFQGYYDKTSGGTQYYNANCQSARNWDKDADTTLYARWAANTYTVRYNANKPANATGNVTGVPGNATWTYDSNATLGSAPSLPGWTFGGWYKEASCTNKLGNAGATLTKPNLRTTSGTYDLYAKWTANQYTLVYNGNGRPHAPASYEVTDVPANATWTYDDPTEVNFGAAPTYGEGYKFDGWYSEAECTNKVANAGESITKANLSSVSGGTVNLYAKWIFTDEVQAVIDEILKTRTCTYQELPNQIDVADTAYYALSDALQEVIISEGYKTILDNAHEVEAVGELVDALGTAEDTPEWRAAVEEAREAYEDLDDKTFNALNPILNVLEDDEAAVVVMDIINNIGDPHWTNESKALIDVANNAYETYVEAGKPEEQIANYETLQYANECYDNVQTFVDKVNAITNNPFEYTDACKELIDEARRYYKEELDDYQKGLATSDASVYYELLVNYENAWNAMYLIDQINDMENDPACGEKIKTAREAVKALDETSELPLVRADLLKELNDKEAAWGVIELINAIYPMEYGEDCEDAIEAARTAYEALEDDQEQFVINYNMLTKAEEDYAAVEAVVAEVAALGEIRHDEESLEKIEHARDAYEALSEDQKGFYPDFSLEDIKDYETAYEALDKIYYIGEISYDTESENKIYEAREFYESLTEEQKELINVKDYEVLTASETEYARQKKNATILVIIMLILACLVILGGIWFLFFLLKRRKKDDDDDEQKGNKKPVKAMSVSGFLPIILTSHFLDAPYIALYVLAGIGVLLWCAILVIVIMKKKQVGPFKKKAVEAAKAGEVESAASEEEEVETITDEKGNVFQIRYIKSFTAKLIQSPEETKKYYEKLKNEVLSYKKTNSRISWHYDAVNSGREYVLKFAIRGKTLCVYLPLDPEKQEEKYKVEKVESKKFEDVPCLYRIKNDRRCEYAKELIAKVCESLGLEKAEEQHEVYSNLPYEPNKPLIARGLIKEQKVAVSKSSEPVVLETKVNADGDEVMLTKDANGNIFEIRYIKSFTAKLSQSEDVVKDYYTVLKNHVLSYKDTHSRVSWHYDAVNIGRDYVLKFAIRGKTLCVFYALDPSKLDEKYKVEEAKGKKFEDVPCLYRIKNDRRLGYAKELIDMLMRKLEVEQGEIPSEDYHIKKESTKALLAKGLIKETKIKVVDKMVEEHYASISVAKADEVMSDEKAEAAIEEDVVSKKREGKKEVVNIDTLSQHYKDGDVVTLDSLIEKKLVSPKAGYVKVLARGVLYKKLTVDLHDYSLQAVKMIVLMGGHAKKII